MDTQRQQQKEAEQLEYIELDVERGQRTFNEPDYCDPNTGANDC